MRRNGREQDAEKLLKKMAKVEEDLVHLKVENKRIQKNHTEEIRTRDRKEVVTLVLVAACVLVYVYVALATRCFV